MSFCWVEEADVREGRFRPRMFRLDERNDPVERLLADQAPTAFAAMYEN
jgi:hypothetical protein